MSNNDDIDVGGAYADKQNRQHVEHEDAHLEHVVPADSAEYLEGDLPKYQSGDTWTAGANEGEAPLNINGMANPMDPSPEIM